MNSLLTRANLNQLDALANLACGTLTLAVPSEWKRLGLPDDARVPAGIAMLTGGFAMLVTHRLSAHRPSLVVASAAANGLWAGLGLLACRHSSAGPTSRGALALIASYDLSMGLGKVAARP